MNSQIGVANSIGFGVQCETYESYGANKIIITGINSEKNLKYAHEQSFIIQTYINKNILLFSNLNLHFNFTTNCQDDYFTNSGLAMFVSLISKLRNIPIENKFMFCGQLDLYGNIYIEKQTDIEVIKRLKIFTKEKILYLPLIDGFEISNFITITNTKELAEKFPVLFKQEKFPQRPDYNCLDLSRCFL